MSPTEKRHFKRLCNAVTSFSVFSPLAFPICLLGLLRPVHIVNP